MRTYEEIEGIVSALEGLTTSEIEFVLSMTEPTWKLTSIDRGISVDVPSFDHWIILNMHNHKMIKAIISPHVVCSSI